MTDIRRLRISKFISRPIGRSGDAALNFPLAIYLRHDACEAWRFAWLASGSDPPNRS